MTNTQFEAFAQALALIHGELVAIRVSCQRAEERANGTPPAESFEDTLARAEVTETASRVEQRDPNPTNDPRLSTSILPPSKRSKRGRR